LVNVHNAPWEAEKKPVDFQNRNLQLPVMIPKGLPVGSIMRWCPVLISAAFGIAFAWVFVLGIVQRFSLPLVPVVFPDSWGYLKQAIAAASGVPVAAMDGRGFAYSFFLSWLLKMPFPYESIVVVQHLIGILAGGLWLAAFGLWMRCIPHGLGRMVFAPACGLACFSLWFLNPQTMHFEMQVMAEAVFALPALAQVFLGLVFLEALRSRQSTYLVFLAGTGMIACGLLCRELKPSWGFSTAVPIILVAGGIFGMRGWGRVAPAAALAVGPLLFAAAVGIPQKSDLWRRSSGPDLSLAKTLVAIHANSILESQLVPKFPEEAESRRLLAEAFVEASKDPGPYTSLGFDPDFLMYSSPVFSEIADLEFPPDRMKAMFFGWYFRALIRQPTVFLEKWGRQITFFLRPDPRGIYRYKFRLDRDYAAVRSSIPSALPMELSAASEAFSAFYKQAENLGQSAGVVTGRPILRTVAQFVSSCLGPIFWASVLAALGVCLAGTRFHECRWPAWGLLFGWASTLGNVITVAVVHSFEIIRYLHMTNSYTLLMFAMSGVFLIVVGERALRAALRLAQPQ
jgi:hypothetical protein